MADRSAVGHRLEGMSDAWVQTRVQCPRCTVEYDTALPAQTVRAVGRCRICRWPVWVAGDERDLLVLLAGGDPDPDVRGLVRARQRAVN